MTVERIECANDARAAAYREVADGELLRSRGVFAAEGRLVVRRLIAARRYTFESLLLNDSALRDLESAIAELDASVPVLVCGTDAFVQLTGYNIHRGCLGLVRRPPPIAASSLIASAARLVVLDGVTNADNVGGVFRNAAAFDVDGVLLSPTTCDPLYRKAIRTSMGAALQVPFARAAPAEWQAAVADLQAAGFTVVALTPRVGAARSVCVTRPSAAARATRRRGRRRAVRSHGIRRRLPRADSDQRPRRFAQSRRRGWDRIGTPCAR
jgi:tRNA G18 (ribose-2'-O)-methylase SpoU